MSIIYHFFSKDNLVKSNSSIFLKFTSTSFIKTDHSLMVTVTETEKSKVTIPPFYLKIFLNDIVLLLKTDAKM